MQVAQRTRPKGPHTFYDQDYKRMERSGFRAKGWNTYSDSPYAEYTRRLAEHETQDENNTGTNRRDS